VIFEKTDGERVSIAAGSLDKPQGLKIAAHIYTDEAGDYYEIDPGVPQSVDHEHYVMLP